jgi:hypothetical protein
MEALAVTDERHGLPSASSIHRLLQCPASSQRSLRAQVIDIEKDYRKAGTDMHAVLAGEMDEDELDSDDVITATKICRYRESDLLIQLGFEDPVCHTEERLWLVHNGKQIASAKPDKIYIESGRFLIPEFKAGRKDVPKPSMNPQLVLAAILAKDHYGVSEGILAVIPAWRQMPPAAEINDEQIELWRAAIIDAITESESPDAPAVAGSHCDFCKARPFCPEAWAIVREAKTLIFNMDDTPEKILANYRNAKHAEGTIKAFLEQVKARLVAQPDAIPGLQIGKPQEIASIPLNLAAWERLTELYKIESVLAAAKLTPAALAKQVSGGKGKAKAQEQLEEELAELITTKPRGGSLEEA